MASAKFLEDALSTDVDESAVNAIVGSLENQLVTSTSVPVQSRNNNNHQSVPSYSNICSVSQYNAEQSKLKEVRISRSQGSVMTPNSSLSYSYVQPLINPQNPKVTMPTYCNEPSNAMMPRSSPVNSIASNNDMYHSTLSNGMANSLNQGFITQSMPMQHSVFNNHHSLNSHHGMQCNNINIPTCIPSGPHYMTSPIKPQMSILSNQNMVMSGPSIMSNMHLTNMRGTGKEMVTHKSLAAVAPRVKEVPGPSSCGMSLQGLQPVPITQPIQHTHLLLKTSNGQYQLLQVGPAPQGANFAPALVSRGEGYSAGTCSGPTMSSQCISHTVTSTTSVANAIDQKHPNNSKVKCRNFFANLLDLSKKEPKPVEHNVKILIQELIDGHVDPEQFCLRLAQLLRATPQPSLIGFLKKTLPLLRQGLLNKELFIEGINPPSPIPRSPIPRSPIQGHIVTPNPQIMYRLPVAGPSGMVPRQSSPGPHMPYRPTFRSPNPNMTLSPQFRPTRGMDKQSPMFSIALCTDDKLVGDDDINDVTAMGGVNLAEETQKILGSTDAIGSQIRSCKEEYLVQPSAMQARCRAVAANHELSEPSPEVAALLSHALEERLKDLVEKLSVIAQHRMDYLVKTDPRYEVTQDVKGQLKFLEEVERTDLKKSEETEREMLMKAAKTRSKTNDPELQLLKAKAKEVQRAEMEEVRQREANLTALQAIGPRKSMKINQTDCAGDNSAVQGASGTSSFGAPPRVRTKRVTQRDFMYMMEQDKSSSHSERLYKYYLK